MTFGFAKIDLKLRITLQVVALASVCFLLASLATLTLAVRSERAQKDAIADVVANSLKLQLEWAKWVKVRTTSFPDLQVVAAPFMSPGLCVAFREPNGRIAQQFCSGTQSGSAPRLFTSLYKVLFGYGEDASHPVVLDGLQGFAVISVDITTSIEQSWHELQRTIPTMAATLIALCVSVYIAIARLLRPTRIIVSGLEALSSSRFSTRLPSFDLAELSAIQSVFNSLAQALERTTADRNALTQRLIDVQDEERLALSRELHDEFGQNLTAIAAIAASAQQTAEEEFPKLSVECRGILRIAEQMMDTLRGALARLRPPDISELGLAATLEDLIAVWNTRLGGKPVCTIDLNGRLDELTAAVAVGIYRIVQEAVTNAARHANAQHIYVRLDFHKASSGGKDESTIALSVEDDGKGIDPMVKAGMGLIGMQERVAALAGKMHLQAGWKQGTLLRVIVPVPSGRVLEDSKQ